MSEGCATSDAELLRACAEGRSEAFGVLFDRHRDRVFRHTLRLVDSVEDAEDVVAIVFLEAWRKRSRIRVVDGSIVAWILVTANNVVRNHTRSRRRYRALLASLPPAAPQPDHSARVLDDMANRTGHLALRRAFDRLSRRDRDVLTLCVLEELSTAETALALRVPLGTVKSRLSRAKVRLASTLTAETAIAATLTRSL